MVRLVLLLLLLSTPCWAQQFLTTQAALLLPSSGESLSVSEKELLSGSVAGQISEELSTVAKDTRVEQLKRTRFLQKETVYDREKSTETVRSRLFKVALVRVMTGELQGKEGWMVVSYRSSGQDPQAVLTEVAPLD